MRTGSINVLLWVWFTVEVPVFVWVIRGDILISVDKKNEIFYPLYEYQILVEIITQQFDSLNRMVDYSSFIN